MRVKLEIATADDVLDLVSLRDDVNRHMMAQYGPGFWSSGATEKGVLFSLRTSTVYVVRARNRVVATLALSARKPWAIDKKYFRPGKRSLYLTSMAVRPDEQRKGVGRRCIDAARLVALRGLSDAIRLDAYDAAAGAGEFYRKCGFLEVGRASYRNIPLIYFEMLL
jgi:GNAT superfamily N-acetyltransferase